MGILKELFNRKTGDEQVLGDAWVEPKPSPPEEEAEEEAEEE